MNSFPPGPNFSLLSLFANSLWYLAQLPESIAFQLARNRVAEAQEALLLRLLAANADTEYGRRFRFAHIGSARTYQQQVPLSTYSDYQAAIEAIGAGQPQVLTKEPVLCLEPTSGSTAATKYIPYTAALKTEFQRALAPWVVNIFNHRPALLGGQAYWSLTPVAQPNQRTSGGVSIGFEADTEYLGGWQRPLLQAVLAVPSPVRFIAEMETFRYVTLLFLLRSRTLRLISVWNPTFLTMLVNPLPQWWPQLVADIHAGTLTTPTPLRQDLHLQLRACNQANPRRAAELRAIFQAESVSARIHTRLWPSLRLISCWAEAQAALHIPELARLFPLAQIQGKGLIATEGFVSLPLVNQPGAALAIRSHFFEFLPEGETQNQTPKLAHELEAGQSYTVILTTGGGFYRYQLHDVVEVTGFWGQCPLLRFVGKAAYISDWFGEKLNERHVRQVLAEIFARHGVEPGFTMVACEEQSNRFAYTLFIELSSASDFLLGKLGQELETALQENFHYRYCRQLGQLGPLQVFRINQNGAECYLLACQAHGQRVGDIKLLALHRLGGWTQRFQGEWVRPAAEP